MSESISSEALKYRHRIRWVIDFEYTLLCDRITVSGSRTWIPRIEGTVFLKDLNPIPSTIWIRSAHFQWAVILLVCVIAVSGLMLPGAERATIPILIFDAVVLLPILLYVYRSRALVQYSRFCTHQGVILLEVGDAGPEPERFEPFVNELIHRIQAVQSRQP